MAITIQVFLAFACLAIVASYHGPDLPIGPFCGKTPGGQCCKSRDDPCSHEIKGTLCYCDEFCMRPNSPDDCCPDYEEVCLGSAPETWVKGECEPTKTKMKQCNKCDCIMDENQPPKWVCDVDTCLIENDVISDVNRAGLSWRAANYTEYYTKKLKDGIVYRLGTFPLSIETLRMNAIRYDKDIPYPQQFDARTHWPEFISPVVDQGWCGSDWAVSSAGVASDRFAIQSNGAEAMVLSPQSLLSCNLKGQQGCHGGHIDVAWNFIGHYGLVDEDCFPYQATKVKCPYRLRGNLLDAKCEPRIPTRTSKYKVGPPYRVKSEQDIMYEIMKSGPVQAVMTVYQDFFHYRDGVYRHSPYGDQTLQGLHSVRIIGWGEDRGEQFWIAANSWGEEWGENGYFRIARGTNESGIESFVVTTLADVGEAYQQE